MATVSGSSAESQTHILPSTDDNPHVADKKETSSSFPIFNQAALFVAHADRVTLAGTAGGLVVITYLLFGKLTLLLIGIIGGVILHVWWEDEFIGGGDNQRDAPDGRKRQELSIEIADRLTRGTVHGEPMNDQDATSAEIVAAADYSKLSPAISTALTALTDSVIRGYVSSWYGGILPSEPEFPKACRDALTRFVLAISSRIGRKRPADIFLQFATNSSSLIIVFLNELSSAVGGAAAGSDSRSAAELIDDYLEKYPDSSLATVLSPSQQEKKLGLVATDVLNTFLEPSLYSCIPLRVFLCETLSRLMLQTTIDTCSKPEYINSWIIHFLEGGEPELMNAIDAGLERAGKPELNTSSPSAPLSSHSEIPFSSIEKDIETDRRPKKAASQSSSADEWGNDRITTPASSTDTLELPSEAISQRDVETTKPGERAYPDDNEYRVTAGSAPTHIQESTTSLDYIPEAHEQEASTSNDTKATVRRDFPPLSGVSDHNRALSSGTAQPVELTGCLVSIVEDFNEDDRGNLRSKPNNEYLLQLEPSNTRHTGWMIARKYSDFEVLHETLRRISVVSGIRAFSTRHSELPSWKGRSRLELRRGLEQYLQHALQHGALAECEAMKKFLEKGRQSGASPRSDSDKSNFPFATPAVFETMGKNVLGVLSTAPKGVASGRKAILEGVSGIFGTPSGESKRMSHSNSSNKSLRSERASMDIQSSVDSNFSGHSKSASLNTPLEDVRRSSWEARTPAFSPSEQQPSRDYFPPMETENTPHSPYESATQKAVAVDTPGQQLPDPPREDAATPHPETGEETRDEKEQTSDIDNHSAPESGNSKPGPVSRNYKPLSEDESVVVVELLFAIINEVYSLSSAWNIRKRLLSAAKSFLLRPGNPGLEAIRTLLQESIIDANTSDEALSGYINKLRESCLPTEEELKAWPLPTSPEEQEKLRIKARTLLVSRGMPPALMGIMGANATGEALGKIFDCLQINVVGRAFVFAIMLQAIKVTTQ
ncbi:hypothetical protein FQN57_000269 [Myotisia sp. PD_48]|nr:hypothetical protein FQN57_000269 [Myotisia sp. PD_48]